MGYRTKTLGTAALLLCVSFSSQALTLGTVRGPVILGRALDVTIPVQVEQTDNAAASCFEAEVFHADVRQPAARVRVSVEPTGATSAVQVRVRSSALVSEPVVSVTLRALCDVKTERRYVLLADLPKGIDPTTPIQIDPDLGLASPRSASASASSPAATNAALSSMSQQTAPAKPQRPNRDKAVATPKESPKPPVKKSVVVAKPAATTSGQSRLQLDSTELFSDRIALLDQDQPDAASDVVPLEQQKMKDMEATVASLQALAGKNEANLRELTAQLRQSEAERFPAWWLYALVALVLAAVAVIVVLLRRLQRGYGNDGEWYSPSVVAAGSSVAPLSKSGRPEPTEPVPIVVPPPMKPRLDPSVTLPPAASQWPDSKTYGVDVSEVEMGESRFGRYIETGEIHNSTNGPSTADPLDLILPESPPMDPGLIAELRQQAEFFVALGQTDQALIVLEKLVNDSDVPDPNVLLDLLGLLHSLSKKAEFQRFRDTFNHAFNGVVPEFFSFRSEGQSLGDYPVTLAHIVAQWATPGALDCINGYLVRHPSQALNAALDLAAFRELLLLQSIAHQLNGVDDDGPVPWVEPPDARLQESPMGELMALDLDLSDPGQEADAGPDAVGSDDVETSPSGLHFNDLTPSRSNNLIDFELPDFVKSTRPDGR